MYPHAPQRLTRHARTAPIHTVETQIRVRGRLYPIRIVRHGDRLTATADIPTPYGSVTVSAEADLGQIRAALARAAHSQFAREMRKLVAVGDDAIVGNAWGDFKGFFYKTVPKEAKKVGRSKVFRKVAEGINGVTDSPAYNIAMAAVNVIPGYGQAISAAMGATKMAAAGMNVLARSSEGDPKAIAAVKKISKAAKAGNPKAKKAMGVLRALNKMPALQKGARVDSNTGMPVDMQVMQTAQGMAEQYIPGLADNQAYQTMKGLYNTGRGVAQMAMGDDEIVDGFEDAEADDNPIEIEMEIGADGVYRPRLRKRRRHARRVPRHAVVRHRFNYGLPPPYHHRQHR